MRFLVALVVTVAMLALPGPASAETIQLGWTETYLYNGRANDRLFVFRVDSVTVTDRSWTVKGSVRNASALRMTIRNRFAVVAGGTAFPRRGSRRGYRPSSRSGLAGTAHSADVVGCRARRRSGSASDSSGRRSFPLSPA